MTPVPEPTGRSPAAAGDTTLPGARTALLLLLAINLFNYIDRQVLAAVESSIETTFYPRPLETPAHAACLVGLVATTVGPAPAASASWLPAFTRAPLDQGLVEARMGSLNLAFMVSYMMFAPLFGWLSGRTTRWLLVGIGVLVWTLASGGSGLAATFTMLFLTRCLVGVGEAAYGPVAPTVIADLYPLRKRGRKLAWFYAAIPVGSALGYVLGGFMFKLTGDWRWAFYVVVPPGLALGLFCFFMPEPPRGQADAGASPHRASLRDWRILWQTPSYVLNTLGMTAMTFAMGALAFWMPRYVHKERGYADLPEVAQVFGIIVVVAGLAGTLLGGLVGDQLRDRFPGAYFLVSAVAMFLGFPFVLLVIFLPFPLAWWFLFLACFCLFFNTGPTNTILANVTHPALRASGFALNIFIIHAFGDAVSPMLVGFLNGYFQDMNVGFLIVSGMFLASGLFWLWGTRYLEEDTRLAPTRLMRPS